MDSELRDFIDESISTEQARIIAEQQFDMQIKASSGFMQTEGTRTKPSVAQGLYPRIDILGNRQPGLIGILRTIIQDAQTKEGTVSDQQVLFTEEYPSFKNPRESIVFSVEESVPGNFSKGPFSTSGGIRPPRALLKTVLDDVENPGYKVAIFGYEFDSIIRLTCFALTNKEANARCEWLQRTMREYEFYPAWQGIRRFFFQKRGSDFVLEENANKLYGRPLDFAVQHEEIKFLRQKTLERIVIRSGITLDESELEVTL